MVVMEAGAGPLAPQTGQHLEQLQTDQQTLAESEQSNPTSAAAISPADRDWYAAAAAASAAASVSTGESQSGEAPVGLSEAAGSASVPAFSSYFSQMAGMYASGM